MLHGCYPSAVISYTPLLNLTEILTALLLTVIILKSLQCQSLWCCELGCALCNP